MKKFFLVMSILASVTTLADEQKPGCSTEQLLSYYKVGLSLAKLNAVHETSSTDEEKSLALHNFVEKCNSFESLFKGTSCIVSDPNGKNKEIVVPHENLKTLCDMARLALEMESDKPSEKKKLYFY